MLPGTGALCILRLFASINEKYGLARMNNIDEKLTKNDLSKAVKEIRDDFSKVIGTICESMEQILQLAIQMKIIDSPYLFQVISEAKFEEFNEFKKSETPDESTVEDNVEDILERV